MNTDTWNLQAAAEIFCSMLFSSVLLWLVVSGDYLSYVTPKMAPYLLFTAGVMLLWALAGAGRLFRFRHRKRSVHCLILVIPILLLLLPHGKLGASGLSSSAGLVTGSLAKTQLPAPVQASPPAVTGSNPPELSYGGNVPSSGSLSSDGYLSTNAYGEPLELRGYDKEAKTLSIPNDEFYNWCVAIFNKPSDFEGFQVSMTGFVYHDSSVMAGNEFVPARLLMSCCVADLAPCGLICTYDKAESLVADSWVTVTGTLVLGEYQGNPEPQIQVSAVSSADPIDGYLYPYP